MPFRLAVAWILTLVCFPAFAAEVDSFRVWTDPEKTRAVLDLDARTDYQLFTLENPPRVPDRHPGDLFLAHPLRAQGR